MSALDAFASFFAQDFVSQADAQVAFLLPHALAQLVAQAFSAALPLAALPQPPQLALATAAAANMRTGIRNNFFIFMIVN